MDSPAATIVRTKVSAACKNCTLRRTKCSGERPQCAYCIKVGGECVYSASVKRGPKKGAKYKQRQSKDKSLTEDGGGEVSPPQEQLNSVASTSTLPALCAVASASESIDSPPRKRQRPLPPPREASPQSQQRPSHSHSHSHSHSSSQTTQHQPQVPLRPPIIPSQSEPTPAQNQFHIPNLSSDVLHHLIPIFFSHVNYQGFPILHEPSFLLAFQEAKVGPALLYAMSAAAASFSTHPAVQLSSVPGGPTSNSGIVWAVASRKCLLAQVDSQFTLQGVQTLAILSAWELAQGCGETAWVDIGTAMRAAQIMGFDDGSELEAVYDGPVPQTEIALRQRIVWALFSLEVILGLGARSISLLGGVASSVALESLPLPMLGNWEKGGSPGDDYEEEEEIPTLFVGGGRIMHSLGVCGVEPFLCRAFEIYARLNRFLNLTRITNASAKIRRLSVPISNRHFPMAVPKGGARDWDPASPFAKLSLDLSTWSMHLPTPFAFNATSIVTLSSSQLSSFYTMHLIYHLGQVALHRPYLSDFRYQARQFPPAAPTDGYSVFVNTCHRKAAIHAISLARVLNSATKCASFGLSPLAGYCAFTGATALLFDADMRGSTAASQALQFFLRFLLTGADFYSSLRPFHATLSTLIALHQSVQPEPSLAPLPRGPSDIVPDFFSRYEAYGIKEPLLAPVLIRGPNTPRQELPPPVISETRGTTPSAEVDGYLSHLREILAAVEENWEDESRPSLSVPRSPAGGIAQQLPLPSPSSSSNNGIGTSSTLSELNLPFTSQYDPFLPISAASPLNPSTPTATTTSESGPSSSLLLLSIPSPIAQSPYSFNQHNPHNKIVHHHHNYEDSFPHPPSSNSHLHQQQQQQQQQHVLTLSTSNPNNGNNHHNNNSNSIPGTPGGGSQSDPADLFTWLFSEPVAETIWDSGALEGFLGGVSAEYPLYPENGLMMGGGGGEAGRMEGSGRDYV